MRAAGGGASRRCATSASSACGAALLTWAVWPQGTAVRIAALVVLSLGALGFNGVLYLIAGRDRGRGARAGRPWR